MEQIKAIETVYNGYKFRSRLEARWAVFFDAAGIRYEYEPVGFKKQNGLCYLPDFYFPEENMYVEVKANRPGCMRELEKAMSFIGQEIPCILILSEIPNPSDALLMFPVLYFHPVNQMIMVRHCPFINEFYGPWVSLDRTGPEPSGLRCDTQYEELCDLDEGEKEMIIKRIMLPHAEPSGTALYNYYISVKDDIRKTFVDDCLLKARKARFEFGEKG